MKIAVLGIDLGKNTCSVVGLDANGKVVIRRRMHRDNVIKLAAGLTPCVMRRKRAVVRITSVAYCAISGTK